MSEAAQVFEVTPHVGIGPLRLGVTPAEVRAAAPGHAISKIGRGREEMIDTLGLTVDYSAGDVVSFIQAFPARGVRVSFAGRDVFVTPADDMAAAAVRQAAADPADFPPGRYEYLFPDPRLALWRGVVGEEPGDQGWAFTSISVHAPGYYEA